MITILLGMIGMMTSQKRYIETFRRHLGAVIPGPASFILRVGPGFTLGEDMKDVLMSLGRGGLLFLGCVVAGLFLGLFGRPIIGYGIVGLGLIALMVMQTKPILEFIIRPVLDFIKSIFWPTPVVDFVKDRFTKPPKDDPKV